MLCRWCYFQKMICGISKMLICLIYTGEVARRVYANSFKTYIWVAVTKYKRLLCQKPYTNMRSKETQSGQHITFFYTIGIVSSSATAAHSKHHPANKIFTILLVSTVGWSISCISFNSSCNTHNSICSCWKSFAYDNGILNGIHHSKKPH